MSVHQIAVLFVVIGTALHTMASLNGSPPWAKPAAWGSWLIASILWAVEAL